MERTFIMLKPDCVRRNLCGEIITRFEHKGLNIVAIKKLVVSEELASRHYKDHVGKPFYPALLEFITSGPVMAMILEGENAIEVSRTVMGPTVGAQPGTIRGDYATSVNFNIVHGSDSLDSAEREIKNFFLEEEMLNG